MGFLPKLSALIGSWLILLWSEVTKKPRIFEFRRNKKNLWYRLSYIEVMWLDFVFSILPFASLIQYQGHTCKLFECVAGGVRIRRSHISHNAPYLPPKVLHNLCFSSLLGITAVPREIGNNAYAKLSAEFGGGQIRYIVGDVQVAYRQKIYQDVIKLISPWLHLCLQFVNDNVILEWFLQWVTFASECQGWVNVKVFQNTLWKRRKIKAEDGWQGFLRLAHCSLVSISLVIRPQYAWLCSSFLRQVDRSGFPINF